MRVMLAAAVLVFLSGCACVPDCTTSHDGFAQRVAGLPGLSHVAQVGPALYRGARPAGVGYRTLRELGVRTIISLRRHHDDREAAEAADLRYVRIPLRAFPGSTPPTDEQIRQFFGVVLDPALQPVYVHCLHGKDRTGTMVAIYRIEVDGWASERAAEEMCAFGYHTWFNDLEAFVRSYERRGFVTRADPTAHLVGIIMRGRRERQHGSPKGHRKRASRRMVPPVVVRSCPSWCRLMQTACRRPCLTSGSGRRCTSRHTATARSPARVVADPLPLTPPAPPVPALVEDDHGLGVCSGPTAPGIVCRP